MKHLFIACALLLTSAFSYAQTAEEIIKKAYEASGGDKWNNISNMKMYASVDAGGGMKLPIEVASINDGRTYTKIDLQGNALFQNVFDGKVLWSTNFMTMAPEKAEKDDTENMKRATKEFPNALFAASKLGYKAELMGEEKVDGVDCFKIKLSKKTHLVEGKEEPNIEYTYVDKETYAIIMTESEIATGEAKGKMMQTKFSDYQEVGGVYMAYSMISGVKDGMTQTITFDKIEINQTIDLNILKFPKK